MRPGPEFQAHVRKATPQPTPIYRRDLWATVAPTRSVEDSQLPEDALTEPEPITLPEPTVTNPEAPSPEPVSAAPTVIEPAVVTPAPRPVALIDTNGVVAPAPHVPIGWLAWTRTLLPQPEAPSRPAAVTVPPPLIPLAWIEAAQQSTAGAQTSASRAGASVAATLAAVGVATRSRVNGLRSRLADSETITPPLDAAREWLAKALDQPTDPSDTGPASADTAPNVRSPDRSDVLIDIRPDAGSGSPASTPILPPREVRSRRLEPTPRAPRTSTSRPRLPVLELLGMSERTIEITVTSDLATLPRTVEPAPRHQPVDEVAEAYFTDLPSIDEPVEIDTTLDTSQHIFELWNDQQEIAEGILSEFDTPIEPQTDQEVDAEHAEWRKMWLAVAPVAVLIVALVALMSGRVPDSQLADVDRQHRGDIAMLAKADNLAGIATAAVVDPTADAEGLSEASVVLAELETTSRDVLASATEEFPSVPLLASADHFTIFTPVRDALVTGTDHAFAIERRLGEAVTYRLMFDRMVALPELVSRANGAHVQTLDRQLDELVGAAEDLAPRMPQVFEAHAEAVASFAAALAQWKQDYIDALRNADQDVAIVLADDLQAQVTQLRTALSDDLNELASWVSSERDAVRRSRTEALTELG